MMAGEPSASGRVSSALWLQSWATAVLVAVAIHGGLALLPVPERARQNPPEPVTVTLIGATAGTSHVEPTRGPASVSDSDADTGAIQTAASRGHEVASHEPVQPTVKRPRRAGTQARSASTETAPSSQSQSTTDWVSDEADDASSDVASPRVGDIRPIATGASFTPSTGLLSSPPGPPPVSGSASADAEASGGLDGAWRHAYGRRVRAHVERHKRYPKRALRRGLEGIVTLTMTISARGTLVRPPSVARSSGTSALDREALRMATAAAPFPRPAGGGVTLEIPIRFSVRDHR